MGDDQQKAQEFADLASAAPTERRRRAIDKLVESETRIQEKSDKAKVRPGFREAVEQLMQRQWREPVIVLRLDEDYALGFDVPGRRLDGTMKGKRLVRRFLWNIARGVGGAVVNVVSVFHGGGTGNPLKREIRVTGAAGAMALDLVDKFRQAKGPWLVCSPSHLAVVDTGPTYLDPTNVPPPQILWQSGQVHGPQISFSTHTITWPDDSTFHFPLHNKAEARHLRNYFEPPNTIHWQGRPEASAE